MTRSVLITGANSGIGLASALELAGAGWDVIGSARTAEKAQVLHDAAAERGVSVRTVLFDVTDADGCASGVTEAQELTGGLTALVNNAGTAQSGSVEDVDDEAALAQLELNLLAPARLCRLVLPAMREQGGGRIVNISSVAGRISVPLMGWYCASKHGLEGLTDALRMEVAGFGIKVVLVEPGSFNTEVWAAGEKAFPEPSHPDYAKAYERGQLVTGNSRFMPDPVWVARTVRLALTQPAPQPRYLVGVDAVGGVLSDKLLPTRVLDAVKASSVGLGSLRSLLPF